MLTGMFFLVTKKRFFPMKNIFRNLKKKKTCLVICSVVKYPLFDLRTNNTHSLNDNESSAFSRVAYL